MMHNTISTAKIVVLDGGLGTTLEIIYGKPISHTPLWSTKPVTEDPESIIQAHISFLDAGARIIQTSTYQCSYETFKKEGYSRVDAERIMLTSVKLADEARTRFLTGNKATNRANIGVALSLGPFGASLNPSGEFNGVYPPPYGPMPRAHQGCCENFFTDRRDNERSIEALEQFHFERLAVFARNWEVWDMIDYVAFETIPLVREITAIRRAMSRLQKEVFGEPLNRPTPWRPWWISCTFPAGQFPEFLRNGGSRRPVRDVVDAMLEEQGDLMAPTGIGVNCTPLCALSGLVADMREAVEALQNNGNRPFLVIYPGGDRVESSGEDADQNIKSTENWPTELGCIAKDSADQLWNGIVVGGCCMVGPKQIQELSLSLLGNSAEAVTSNFSDIRVALATPNIADQELL